MSDKPWSKVPRSQELWIGIDFDGTVVTHAYPGVGLDIGAQPWLTKLANMEGVNLMLVTMRSGAHLTDAEWWFNTNLIGLSASNVNPMQHLWTTSPKPYCHLLVDDVGLGVPLKFDPDLSDRAFVDWDKAGPMLLQRVAELLR